MIHIKAGKHRAREMIPFFLCHFTAVMSAYIFSGGNQETCRTTGRIADGIFRRRLNQCDHHVANMLRCSELTILPGCLNFPKHVFIKITLHVLAVEIMRVEIIHASNELLQYLRCRNQENSIRHVLGKCCFFIIHFSIIASDRNEFSIRIKIRQLPMFHGFNRREHKSADDIKHFLRILIFEIIPAHSAADFRIRKNRMADGFAKNIRHLFIFLFLLVQRANEHQVCQLFNDGQRIRNPARI